MNESKHAKKPRLPLSRHFNEGNSQIADVSTLQVSR